MTMNIGRWMAAGVVLAALIGTPAWAGGRTPAEAAPGTASRPVLSPAEAAQFRPSNYLGWSGTYAAPVRDPWRPRPIVTGRPDFVVGGHGFATVQAAVNAAVRAGGTARRYIAIRPGVYTGTVFIPAGSPPLTLY